MCRKIHIISCRLLMTLAMGPSCHIAAAQERCVVIDKETGTPIRNVKVYTNNGQVAVTDYQGRVKIDSVFNSATLSHVSYLPRNIERREMRDTLWLLPRENRLDEVVVWGEDRKNIKSMVASATADAPAYAPAPGLVTFDFFSLIKKKPLSRKARKKNKELLRDWDKIYGNGGK